MRSVVDIAIIDELLVNTLFVCRNRRAIAYLSNRVRVIRDLPSLGRMARVVKRRIHNLNI